MAVTPAAARRERAGYMKSGWGIGTGLLLESSGERESKRAVEPAGRHAAGDRPLLRG